MQDTPDARAESLQKTMVVLLMVLVALQAGDGISTHWVLGTGKGQEENHFLLGISSVFSMPVLEVVFVAKILCAGIFGLAALKTKASKKTNFVLAFLVFAFAVLVAKNFYWAIALGGS
jgi:hypothetical protein